MSSAREAQAVLPPDHNSGPGILAESYILLVIATSLIVVRSYVRLSITNCWGWDDTTIIIAWIFLLIGAILINLETNLGLGRHTIYLANPEQQTLDILKYNTFFQMDNVICTLFTKISISFLILRIRSDKTLRYVIWTAMMLMTMATVTILVVLCIACIPLKALWTPSLVASAKCIPLKTVYNVAYVQSGFSIVVDLCLTASPIVVLWHVKINKRKKILICFLMSLGLVATVTNALRNAFVDELTSKDMTYAIRPITICAILELSSGVIAACLPACMPIFQLRKHMERRERYGYSFANRTGASGVGNIELRSNTSKGLPGENWETDDGQDTVPLKALHFRSTTTTVEYGGPLKR
ncbi:hypothetical protein BGZ60DRAFT_392534 [Tricladium varicosporioides]|nr:hypothetical protein BGZ60DRAFT_392534 [Hymenoscyphus varicosporioides]